MRNRFKHRAQNKEEEAYYQEILEGEEIPNQWSLRLRKIESVYLPPNVLKDDEGIVPVDVKRALLLTKDRTASITFDISILKKYTICVMNESDVGISFSFELSPNNVNFVKRAADVQVDPGHMECVSADEYLKYARISVKGHSSASVIVYLQGYK